MKFYPPETARFFWKQHMDYIISVSASIVPPNALQQFFFNSTCNIFRTLYSISGCNIYHNNSILLDRIGDMRTIIQFFNLSANCDQNCTHQNISLKICALLWDHFHCSSENGMFWVKKLVLVLASIVLTYIITEVLFLSRWMDGWILDRRMEWWMVERMGGWINGWDKLWICVCFVGIRVKRWLGK